MTTPGGPAAKRVVAVRTAGGAYDVLVGAHLLSGVGDRLRTVLAPARALLVCDGALPEAITQSAAQSLERAGLAAASVSLHASEADKSLDTLGRLLEAMAACRLERSDVVVALGGGVVGDVAGFAAAVYRRGVAVVQCPTTLLAMVDASVGGKTAVNLRVAGQLRKNMVGAFWQPALVLCDVRTLRSLPARQLRAGLAECVKHALIASSTPWARAPGAMSGPALLDWTLEAIPAVEALEEDALVELVARNVAVKASVVEQDEREEAADDVGGRALLNLGHTFAHAVEPLTGLRWPDGQAASPLLHGEAVALGLVAAGACAEALGLLEAADVERIRRALTAAKLPTCVAGLPDDEALLQAMRHDKKQRKGAMRLALPGPLGCARVVRDPPLEAVKAGLAAIRA